MRWQFIAISIFCIVILAMGFYASWTRLYGDEYWLARSGGTVVFVAGSWLTITVNAHRHKIENYSKDAIETIRKITAEGLVVSSDEEEILQKYESVLKGSGEKIKEIARTRFEHGLTMREMEVNYYKENQVMALRFIELFWLGVGTLIWAWGDMIQYLIR